MVRHGTLTPAFAGSNPAIPAILSEYDSLAQSAEQLPFKQWVRGSNPRRVTTSEQRPLCSDVLLFLRNKRTSSARFLAPLFPLRWAHSGRTALWKAFFRYREGCPFQINSPTSSEQLVYSSEEVGLFSAKPRYIKDWLLPYF